MATIRNYPTPADGHRRRKFSCPRVSIGAAALILAAFAAGCARYTERPEIAPDLYSPVAADQPWKPTAPTAPQYRLAAVTQEITRSAHGLRPAAGAARYDLPRLIDLALRLNPRTRQAWQSARAAAAAYAIAQAPYYPHASFEADGGYNRLLFQVAPGPAVIKQWSASPMAELTYTLLDFGRRGADSELARQQLAAANFGFNRTMQTVVFAVQRSYYAVAAAQAAVQAAAENLKLASTDLAAVARRVDLGLATEPALLLARERKAQADFELESARTLVNDARAALAVAVGVAADEPLEIQPLENQPVPKTLGKEVEQLIGAALHQRPDLEAEAAKYQASVAAEKRSRARWYPVVAAGADYGEQAWWYNFADANVIKSASPQYAALLTLRWDIFTGFSRVNDDRRTEAERAAERESVKSLELETIAEVWRSYYDFQTAAKKYQFAQALLAAAQESYNDNLETYRQGLSTIVELLTADTALANARFTMIQSTADLLTASATVAYAVGAVDMPRR
ncbi:MAG TPA: TolC family protein [Candidatus Binataceae bacterium]|nr:TolC family protein [Candidatus Binataceae bacterium]